MVERLARNKHSCLTQESAGACYDYSDVRSPPPLHTATNARDTKPPVALKCRRQWTFEVSLTLKLRNNFEAASQGIFAKIITFFAFYLRLEK